jgi:hypothetical protein
MSPLTELLIIISISFIFGCLFGCIIAFIIQPFEECSLEEFIKENKTKKLLKDFKED